MVNVFYSILLRFKFQLIFNKQIYVNMNLLSIVVFLFYFRENRILFGVI